MGIKKSLFILCLSTAALQSAAQGIKDEPDYERSSLYMMMVKHPQYAYNKEIEFVFSTMAKPVRFNDHSLKTKTVVFSSKDKDLTSSITAMLAKSQLAKRLVGRWFNRNPETGAMNLELLRERGIYNASAADWALANKTIRGQAMLEDAGEQLINNTYLVMNDIRYVDKSTVWNTVKEVASFASTVTVTVAAIKEADGLEQVNDALASALDVYEGVDWLYGSLTDNIKGFTVNVTSYLYRLKWNEDVAGVFYKELYTDSTSYDKRKASAWQDAYQDLFELEYVGKIENRSAKTVLFGVKTNGDLIRKVCTRALDKNLADLQHKFEPFRIKAPLINADPIQVQIGRKEDVDENSLYEVLERFVDDNGHTTYKRRGTIRPNKGQIWDNRFMAVEEGAENAEIGFTTFTKVSGGGFYPGMLVREIK